MRGWRKLNSSFHPAGKLLIVRSDFNVMSVLADILTEIQGTFRPNWAIVIVQLLSFLCVAGLFSWAASLILSRESGLRMLMWLLLAFCIPVVFPIVTIIHFRRSGYQPELSGTGPKLK